MKIINRVVVAIALCFSLTFAQSSEDQLIIEGIVYSEKNPQKAAAKWKRLFELTNKESYLMEYFYASLKYKKIQDVIKEIKTILRKKKSKDLYELLASLYSKEGDTKGLLELVETMSTKDIQSMYELAYLYAIEGNDAKALELYKEIYKKDKSWDSLKGILSSLARKKRVTDAKDTLWREVHRNSKLPQDAYLVLIGLLDQNKEPQKAIYAFQKMYQISHKKEYIKNIISLYIYTKEYSKLIKLLEETHYDNKLLYELYLNKEQTVKAYKLLHRIYKETHNPKWLAEKAILTFEIAKKYNALDKRVITAMGELFEKAFKGGVIDAGYYNYYGYTLIDSDISLPKGMDYVRKAIKLEPNNVYYLDSLMWGYYKLHQCMKAKSIVKQIKKLQKESKLEDDIISHIKMIQKCKEQ